MNFRTDKQTLKDLEIFDSYNSKQSIYSLFGSVQSIGARNKLHYFLNNPVTDIEIIKNRSDAIAFFSKIDFIADLDIDKNTLDFIEHYLLQSDYPTKPPSKIRAIERAFQYKIKPSNEYYIIERGIDYIIDLLNNMHSFALKLADMKCPKLIEENNNKIISFLELPELAKVKSIRGMQKLKAVDVASFDYVFRYMYKDVVRFFLELVYEYDVFLAVSEVAVKKGYSYPEILQAKEFVLEVDGLFHPFIKDAIRNDLKLTVQDNLLFLTGSNMAGKSSLLKALSLSVYLAHVGFPVPAQKARVSVLNGLYTTINLSDNLNLGYSHFYSEVIRIKEIVESLREKRNILVVFDELFRGTNVKDAYDGSLAIISALSDIKNCFFTVSTHILEISEELKDKESIQFRYMETVFSDGYPQYTYLLKEGVSEDRMGMYIIKKEGILDMLTSICKKE